MDEFSNAVRSAGDARALAGRGAGERTDAGFGPTKESTRRTRCARGVLDARPALTRRRTLTRPAGTFFDNLRAQSASSGEGERAEAGEL